MSKKNSLSGALFLISAAILWGSSFAATKVALKGFAPITLAAVRFLVASVVLFSYEFVRRGLGCQFKLNWFHGFKRLLVGGFVGVFLMFVMENYAIDIGTSSFVGVIMSSDIIFIAILSYLLLGERLHPMQFGGLILCVIGAIGAFASASDLSFISLENALLSGTLTIGASVCWAIYSIVLKSLDQTPLIKTAWTCLIGACALTITAVFVEGEKGINNPELIEIVSLLYLGVLVSGVAYFFWAEGLHRVPAGIAGGYLSIAPIVAIGAGVILGENFSWLLVLSALVVVSGLLLMAFFKIESD